MSSTLTIHPILGCLVAADKHFEKTLNWTTINDLQRRFIDLGYEDGKKDVELLGDEIKTKASGSCGTVNKFLADNGFPDLQLNDIGEASAVYLASILKVLLKWAKEGKEREITRLEPTLTKYPGVFMDSDDIEYFSREGHKHPIAKIPTKTTGQHVFMTQFEFDEKRKDLFDVMEWLLGTDKNNEGDSWSSMKFHPLHIEDLTFPMIDYDQSVDISWLQEMRTPEYYIDQAIQQTRFAMNEIGAKVESAAAMSLKCRVSQPKQRMIIDKPFLLWITRDNMHLPFFIGHFTEEDWKKPKIDFEDGENK